jgi:hypothetical protein
MECIALSTEYWYHTLSWLGASLYSAVTETATIPGACGGIRQLSKLEDVNAPKM